MRVSDCARRLTEEHFAERCADLVERTLLTVQLLLDDAGVRWDQLTRLILVGGSTRMPMIRRELERSSSMTLDRSLSPDEAVSHGAALYAGMILGKQGHSGAITIGNVNSHDLGVLAMDPKTGKPRRQIMIPRNSSLPAKKEVRFRTHEDNQANVRIDVVEGGDDRGINATQIGKCIVDDLPGGTRKGTHVDVTFDYGTDGRLTVHARLPEVEREISMTLDRAAGLAEEDLVRWEGLLDAGLSDAVLAQLDDSSSDSKASIEPTADPPMAQSESADEVLEPDFVDPEREEFEDPVFAPLMEPAPTQHTPSELPRIGEETAAKVTAADLAGLADAAAPAPMEAPLLNLDAGNEPPQKADTNDFAQLAALARDAEPSPASSDVPLIVTDPAEASKKSGGMFKRRKKR